MTTINGENGNNNVNFHTHPTINIKPNNDKIDKIDITLTHSVKKPDVDTDYKTLLGVDLSPNALEAAKKKPELETIPQIDLSSVTSEDRKAAFHLVDNPLVQAYMYGPIDCESAFARMDKLDGFAEDLMLPGDRVGGLGPEDEIHIV